jgi:catechol 2,3-dioxygenase-like lactoylglutathione lyase family enzyme
VSQLKLVALIVHDYDAAIRFFVDVLQFELVEDSPSLTNDGRPKRWVVVRPPGVQTGILRAGHQEVRATLPTSVVSRPAPSRQANLPIDGRLEIALTVCDGVLQILVTVADPET